MVNPVKCLGRIHKTYINGWILWFIQFNDLLQSINALTCRMLRFKPKLIIRRIQILSRLDYSSGNLNTLEITEARTMCPWFHLLGVPPVYVTICFDLFKLVVWTIKLNRNGDATNVRGYKAWRGKRWKIRVTKKVGEISKQVNARRLKWHGRGLRKEEPHLERWATKLDVQEKWER